jgi:hypothetical protein
MFQAKPSATAIFMAGDRVPIASSDRPLDAWDRYGTVVKTTRKLVHVKMDVKPASSKIAPNQHSSVSRDNETSS